MFIRLWMLIILAAVASYAVIKIVLKKDIAFIWILLFWVITVFSSAVVLYGLSILIEAQ